MIMIPSMMTLIYDIMNLMISMILVVGLFYDKFIGIAPYSTPALRGSEGH